MKGAQLKKYLQDNEVEYTRLAHRMGVTKQSLYQSLCRENLSTAVLESIAEALDTLPEKIYEEMREKKIL